MKKWHKVVIALVVIAAAVIAFPHLSALTKIENLRSVIEPFGVLAPLAFSVIYIIAGLIFVPLSLFSIVAGVLFGTVKGLITVLAAATLGGAIAFLIARQLSHFVPEAKGGIIRKLQKMIEKRLEKNTFETIAVLRMLYLNYIGLSYAAGLVRTCRFWPYVLATFLTNIVGSFVFVYFGAQLGSGLKALLLPLALVVLTLLIPRVVKRFTKKK